MTAITLLRYPGGKTRAVKKLLPLIPKGADVCSPFCGGASVEIALANRGQRVFCYDSYKPLVDFWNSVQKENKKLVSDVLEKSNNINVSKELFKCLQSKCKLKGFNSAAEFFIVNRCSFSGATNSGGMSKGHPRFNKRSVDKLSKFNSDLISFENMCFTESIAANADKFLFLDPPYDIDCFLYGDNGSAHKGFDHKHLAELLLSRGNWLLTYNDNKYIRELYSGCDIQSIEWAYGMNSTKKSSEIIITPTI